MSAAIIDGKAFATTLRGRVGEAARGFAAATGRKAGLAVVLVGEDPASQVYVRTKARQTREAGMASFEHKLDAATPEAELVAYVPTNTLIVTDTASNVRKIAELVGLIDIAAPETTGRAAGPWLVAGLRDQRGDEQGHRERFQREPQARL